MNKNKSITRLQLFVEKADKLLSSNFDQNTESGSGVKFTYKEGQTPIFNRWGPDDEFTVILFETLNTIDYLRSLSNQFLKRIET